MAAEGRWLTAAGPGWATGTWKTRLLVALSTVIPSHVGNSARHWLAPPVPPPPPLQPPGLPGCGDNQVGVKATTGIERVSKILGTRVGLRGERIKVHLAIK